MVCGSKKTIKTCIVFLCWTSGLRNHGRPQHSHSTRHRYLCVLQHRFDFTREMEFLSVEDWLDNSKWFDIKLLIGSNCSSNNTRVINSQCFAKTLRVLNKDTEKITQIVCQLGPCYMDELVSPTHPIVTFTTLPRCL
jgi:hypothetical protein